MEDEAPWLAHEVAQGRHHHALSVVEAIIAGGGERDLIAWAERVRAIIHTRIAGAQGRSGAAS